MYVVAGGMAPCMSMEISLSFTADTQHFLSKSIHFLSNFHYHILRIINSLYHH